MDDIFREVDEQYRQEQLLQFWHANARLIMLALVLAIAGAGATGFWKSHQMAQRQTETYALAHAVGDAATQKPADALAALNKAGGEVTGHRVTPARFATAKAMLDAGDKPGAIKLYDAIAGDGAATATQRDLAEITSIGLQIQDADPKQLEKRLDKFTCDYSLCGTVDTKGKNTTNAFIFSARELEVLLAMRQSDMQKAHDIAAALAKDPKAPDGVHTRAGQLAALTGEGLAPSPADAPSDNEPTVETPEAR